MKTTPVAILVRVSSRKQDTDRQITELADVAASKGWKVVETVRVTITGSARVRGDLDRVVAMADAGEIEKVLVHEVSRIGRRNSVTHKFVEDLTDAKVSLYWHAQSIETLLPSGKTNPAAALMLAFLAEIARNEKETLVDRIISGLDEARRKGVVLGRPSGSSKDAAAVLVEHDDIAILLHHKKSVRDIAARTGKSPGTVMKVKKLLAKSPGGR